MADPNVNKNPNLKSLPGEAGNFFAGINARIRDAEKKARDEAEGKLLPPAVKTKIDELRRKITNNVNIVKDNRDRLSATALNGLIASTNLYKTQKANLLTQNKFEEKYANLQNEKRIARKRQREPSSVQVPSETVMNEANNPSSVQVPSDADMMKASEDADAALAGADELLTEPEDELPLPPTAAQPVMPPPPPSTEPDSANANKLAKVIADSLTTAAQPSLIMPPAPPLAEDMEVDMPAPFNVTEKPQPAPSIETVPVQAMQEPTITPGALANVIINALKLASAAPVPAPEPILAPAPAPEPVQAPVPAPVPAPEPVQAPAHVMQEPTITPGELANVIVNALKLASTAPVPAPVPAQVPAQDPTILPGALANVIVNALKLATKQTVTTPDAVQPTTAPETAQTVTASAPAQTSVAGDKCVESPGFISLIQKYLEPIIGQFSPPETKPQKVFDKTQLPENMQRILDDANIRYIGRYRTESKPGANAAQRQTTYLFWNTSTHDYTSQTLTDVANDVMATTPAKAEVPVEVQVEAQEVQAPEVQAPEVQAEEVLATGRKTRTKAKAKAEEQQKAEETALLVNKMPDAPNNPIGKPDQKVSFKGNVPVENMI